MGKLAFFSYIGHTLQVLSFLIFLRASVLKVLSCTNVLPFFLKVFSPLDTGITLPIDTGYLFMQWHGLCDGLT